MPSPSHTNEENKPTIVVQVSDLHLREGPDGVGPAERMERALAQVSALQPYPDAVLVSGDVVDTPSRAAYEQARELLGALGLPVHVIPGNHDDRDMLRAHLGGGGYEGERLGNRAPVNFALTCGGLRLVGCDTTQPGHDGGALGAEQLGWLDETLAHEPQTPTLLALHHPPVLTGVRVMDAIALALADRAPLETMLEAHPQVQAITCGHVHTTMSTSFAGRPLLICPSTNSTVRLDLRPREDLQFTESDQPPGFAVHTLVDGRLVSHVQEVGRGAGGG
jgi:Icc protein